jgi:hypothetical protein
VKCDIFENITLHFYHTSLSFARVGSGVWKIENITLHFYHTSSSFARSGKAVATARISIANIDILVTSKTRSRAWANCTVSLCSPEITHTSDSDQRRYGS